MDLDKWPTKRELEVKRKKKNREEKRAIRKLLRMQERRMRDLKRDPDVISKENELLKKYPNIKLKRKVMPGDVARKVKEHDDFLYKRPFL